MRTWPLVNGTATQHNYTDPIGMVHVTTGAAGAVDTDSFDGYPVRAFEAFRDDENGCNPFCRRGFGAVTVHNGTHLSFEQRGTAGELIDSFTLVRQR